MKLKSLIAVLPVIALLASCDLSFGSKSSSTRSTMSSGDVSSFQTVFMSSYFAERGNVATSARALTPFLTVRSKNGGKATVPVATLANTTFATLVSSSASAPVSITGDYPEPGQKTTFTVKTYDPGNNVYDVTATTTYTTSATETRKSYVEEYYVRDIGKNSSGFFDTASPDLVWTIDDPVVKYSSGSWTQDQSARVKMVLTFTDGTVRNETIVSSSLSGGKKFDPTAFDVATGSYDLSQAFIPKETTDATVMFSSIVIYDVTPSTSYNYWFWSGTNAQTILGIRYYTEVANPTASTYTAYTASFEKAVSTLTTTGGSFAGTLANVYSGSTFDTLAETVLRQRVVYGLAQSTTTPSYYIADSSTAGAMTTKIQTRVVNITGKKDFYLTQLDSDAATLSDLTSTVYIPTGNVSEILAASTDSTTLSFARTQQITPATGTLPFAVATTDVAGLGSLGTVYTSITEGYTVQAVSSTANLPTSNVISTANTEWSFNGQQVAGTQIAPASLPVLTTKGTVEAWVYINTMTDTMGIIHKGTSAAFTDEAYSMQGWGSTGQIGFLIDNPGGAYDIALSNVNLNTKKWYYLVGTWDITATKPSINLYINGALSGSNTTLSNTKTKGAADASTIGLMVGSQLPTSYSTTYGYFGVNGKIMGVNLSQTPMSAKEVADKYAKYKDSTANW
jgi:hypothetical protein